MEQIEEQSETCGMPNGPPGEIDRRLFLQYLATGGLAGLFVAEAAKGASPGAYWYWLGGSVTREGRGPGQ